MTNDAFNYVAVNKQSWNNRVAAHLQSRFYDVDAFLAGKNSLNSIELDLLGDLSGKTILHLQCHFGQDSISLSRLGAKVTGVDFSEEAIIAARDLASKTNSTTEFICCDIYDLPTHFDKQFDLVFTSYGTISWLPDLRQWAAVINRFLKPGGKFVFVEFHPVLWMYDDDFTKVAYSYFNDAPIIENETGTYADREAKIEQQSICWNHSLEEVFTALLSHDLNIKTFKEYNYSPYDCFRHTEEVEPGKFQIKQFGDKIPMVFSLVAEKPVTYPPQVF